MKNENIESIKTSIKILKEGQDKVSLIPYFLMLDAIVSAYPENEDFSVVELYTGTTIVVAIKFDALMKIMSPDHEYFHERIR